MRALLKVSYNVSYKKYFKKVFQTYKRRRWICDEFLQCCILRFKFYHLINKCLSITDSNVHLLPNPVFLCVKYWCVSHTIVFFIGTICILTIDYCYIHVKGAFAWYIFSFDKILFRSLSSKFSCFILSVHYQILSNGKVYLSLKYLGLKTDVVHSCSYY